MFVEACLEEEEVSVLDEVQKESIKETYGELEQV